MKGKGGFTLIELVVVLIVLGILASIAIPTYLGTIEKARATEAIEQLDEIKISQAARVLSRGTYAANLTTLGYSADTWTPSGALWNYTTDITAITATRVGGGQAGRTIIMVLGNITDGQPGPVTWGAGNHSGQP